MRGRKGEQALGEFGGDPPDDESDADFDVGYRKPPKSTRFKPGMSGNPRGRPKKSDHPDYALLHRPAQKILQEELYRPIKVRQGDREVKVPVLQAVARAAAVAALKGSTHAQRTLLTIGKQLEEETIRRVEHHSSILLQVKMQAEELLEKGVSEKLLPIHPEDILTDDETGIVWVRGPASVEQRKQLDKVLEYRDEQQAIIRRCNEAVAEGERVDDLMEASRWLAQQTFDAINEKLPPRYQASLEGRLPDGAPLPKLLQRRPKQRTLRARPRKG